MILTGQDPVWTPPTHDMEILVRGSVQRVYTDDQDGKDDCKHDREEQRKEKSFFFSMLPRAVSIIPAPVDCGLLPVGGTQVLRPRSGSAA